MKKLKIELENCYGIKKLEKEFSFETNNVNLIYAKNGSMKTSFAKVFKKYQEGNQDEICDEIFGEKTEKNIKIINGQSEREILENDIFVIKSFENSYESESVSSLLINDELKEKLKEVFKKRDEYVKYLKNKSGLKIDEIEPLLLEGFNNENSSFLNLVDCIDLEENIDDYIQDIKYNDIYKVEKKIKSKDFIDNIAKYKEKSGEIYQQYTFLKSGDFSLNRLKNVEKQLKKENFFYNEDENKIIIKGTEFTKIELSEQIKEIEKKLKETEEFKKIEKLLGDAGGTILKEIIENNPEIIIELLYLDTFYKKMWHSYFIGNKDNFEDLKSEYNALKNEIDNVQIDKTPWKNAIGIFNDRFTLPFKMEVENFTSVIIGENTPKIVFNFCKDGNFKNLDSNNWKILNRDEVEGKDTLSQGEKRALYLLNIIFDIEKFKKEFEENNSRMKLLIIDDIADSFDYKNKYAIMEYLKEISEIENFKIIILSHNFDFFRTLSSRLDMSRENKFHIIKNNDEIIIEKEHYQNNPFKNWKNNLNNAKFIIALIPFIRNLIEFGNDREKNNFNGTEKDFIFLTNLLHLKEETINITFGDLKIIYKEYLGKDNFDNHINNDDKIFDTIIDISDNIGDDEHNLENKVILAIAIRLIAEDKMIRKINDATFVNMITGNQTRILFKKILEKNLYSNEKIKIIASVNIMTPENIHLNSFMYEPILDMDIIELKKLYEKVKNL